MHGPPPPPPKSRNLAPDGPRTPPQKCAAHRGDSIPLSFVQIYCNRIDFRPFSGLGYVCSSFPGPIYPGVHGCQSRPLVIPSIIGSKYLARPPLCQFFVCVFWRVFELLRSWGPAQPPRNQRFPPGRCAGQPGGSVIGPIFGWFSNVF